MHISYFSRLLAVPFQSVEEVSNSRIQARRDWTERMSLRKNGGETREKGTALSSVTEAFEFPTASGTENSDWFFLFPPLLQRPSARITFARSIDRR